MTKLKELAFVNANIERKSAAPVAASVNPVVAVEAEEVDILKELEEVELMEPTAEDDRLEWQEEMDMNKPMVVKSEEEGFDFSIPMERPAAKVVYDNLGAKQTVDAIMERGSNLQVEFRLDKDNYLYAWLEAKGVAGFKYYLKPEAFKGILHYLFTGEHIEFDRDPMSYEKANFTDDFHIMKMFVDKGLTLQFTPLFREHLLYITAFLPCRRGKISFRVKRTEEIIAYLREADQII